jgi:hypothetical protein
MRLVLIAPLALAACANGWSPSAVLIPSLEIGAATQDADYAARRGQTELAVKAAWPDIAQEIGLGGGPALTAAMDAARVPLSDRPTRLYQLASEAGTYSQSPEALIASLMVWGSPA